MTSSPENRFKVIVNVGGIQYSCWTGRCRGSQIWEAAFPHTRSIHRAGNVVSAVDTSAPRCVAAEQRRSYSGTAVRRASLVWPPTASARLGPAVSSGNRPTFSVVGRMSRCTVTLCFLGNLFCGLAPPPRLDTRVREGSKQLPRTEACMPADHRYFRPRSQKLNPQQGPKHGISSKCFCMSPHVLVHSRGGILYYESMWLF